MYLAVLLPVTSFAFLDKIVLRLNPLLHIISYPYSREKERWQEKMKESWICEDFPPVPVRVCIHFILLRVPDIEVASFPENNF